MVGLDRCNTDTVLYSVLSCVPHIWLLSVWATATSGVGKQRTGAYIR